MRVLVVNVGSSTIKLSVVERRTELVASAVIESDEDLEDAVESMAGTRSPEAVGHRIVHGGSAFRAATLLDGSVVKSIAELGPLAPLHQRRGLTGVDALRGLLPDLPHVACFDTAFFADLPLAAQTYALPWSWNERLGLRRFGFHGLSHSYAARRATSLMNTGEGFRIVTCHLGSGASVAAVRDGRAVDTTMGFTPLEGLVMATRSGSIDPGMLLWLQTEHNIGAEEISDVLEHQSGLLGLAGTADMREALARSESGDGRARLALDVYLHRLRAAIAAMVAAMDGLDGLVFTGGIGERASEIRAGACDGLSHLEIQIEAELNASDHPDARVDAAGSAVPVFVIEAREDLEIAEQVERLLAPHERLGDG